LHLSIEQLAREDADATAIDLLGVLAVLAPTGVPIGMLIPAGRDPVETARLRGRVLTAIGVLLERALVTETTGGSALLMHRLTQRVIREALARAGKLEKARERAANYIKAAIPEDTSDPSVWPACAELFPHAHAVLDLVNPAMQHLTTYLFAAGQYRAAVKTWGGIADAATSQYGSDHPDTLNARSELARCTSRAGDRHEAVRLFQQLLPDLNRVLGPDDATTLDFR